MSEFFKSTPIETPPGYWSTKDPTVFHETTLRETGVDLRGTEFVIQHRLGPAREEALAILEMAFAVCVEHDAAHDTEQSQQQVRGALGYLHNIGTVHEYDLLECADDFDKWAKVDEFYWLEWTCNVCRFCADVLRWAHEEERRREMSALQGFWTMFDADSQTRAPTMKGWASIAQELEKWLGYDVRIDNGIQLRHGRLSFDPNHKVFVFTWTERKKFLDF